MIPLPQLLRGTPYAGYAYSYPHKTAYRPLDPPRSLRQVWAEENKSSLYLYLHVPFCEMRCGFCNLFTAANPQDELVERYLLALRRQAFEIRQAIGAATYARMAIGGGTPTYLQPAQLQEVFSIVRELFAVDCRKVPTSVETSPRTADAERLAVLKEHGVDRVSIGVQSLLEAEVNASGRAQKNEWVESAIGRIRELGFPTLNVDLIYGLPGQTMESWLTSLRSALRWWPEEFYLYPLYIRPLTGLSRWGGQAEDDLRLACYRHGRDLLLAEGYEQISMRMFRASSATEQGRDSGPVYCCQEDGMVGIGCGARSYTRALHYSTDYAVAATAVREIIADYAARPPDAFAVADYGYELDETEQRRRWIIKSLLRTEGMDLMAYQRHFGTNAQDDLPALEMLEDAGYVECAGRFLRPTPDGLERSDAIGPWLGSDAVAARITSHVPR
jgi:oxygen-independent coproporphyrinogen-3 oxidase